MGSSGARETLTAWSRKAGTVAVLTDIDGTLAPIAPTPDAASVPGELKELLRRLSEHCLVVAAVSGRAAEDARELVGLDGLVYAGNHGFELLREGRVEVVPEAAPYREAIAKLNRRARQELGASGVFVEEKGITTSVHYRNVPPEVGERCAAFVKREGERLGMKVTTGRGVVEARPPVPADKGTAARRLVEEYRPERALFIGDDTTDLDAFRALEALHREGTLKEILRIGVASEEGPPGIVSEADIAVDGVAGVGEALLALLGE